MLTFRVKGKGSEGFLNEAGGHRWQRVPPNEKRDRVHTSTVTVAVLREPTKAEVILQDKDLDWKTCRGSGAGGQHINKVSTTVVLTHKPTNTRVRIQSRSQLQNKKNALQKVMEIVQAGEEESLRAQRNDIRSNQLGSGMRGDKRRTVREQEGMVVDKVTGKKTTLHRYASGFLEDLW